MRHALGVLFANQYFLTGRIRSTPMADEFIGGKWGARIGRMVGGPTACIMQATGEPVAQNDTI